LDRREARKVRWETEIGCMLSQGASTHALPHIPYLREHLTSHIITDA
jgi:hypothetical protein